MKLLSSFPTTSGVVALGWSLLAVAAFLLGGGVEAAGDEEDVLFKTISDVSPLDGNTTKYYCTFRNLWTKERNPVNFPEELARWAGPVMWTHTLDYRPWRAGDATTAGIEQIAEGGYTSEFLKEVKANGKEVFDTSINPDYGFFTSGKDFVHMPGVETNANYPFFTAMAGIDPSPDWFTGFYSFWLVDEYERRFYDHFKIQSYPWDGGTDDGKEYNSVDEDNDPPKPVQKFTKNTAPADGSLLSPDGEIEPVAEWECFLIVGEEDFVLPDCDWYMDPCCNETDSNCGATLPNGAAPTISEEAGIVSGNSGSGATTAMHLPWALMLALGAGLVVQWMS